MFMPTGIKGIINVMLLNHPQTIPHPKEGVVKKLSFWSLEPKTWHCSTPSFRNPKGRAARLSKYKYNKPS